MAFSKYNEIIHGFSGKLGQLLVFRQRAGRTIAAAAPRPSDVPDTEKQLAVRDKFLAATRYCKSAMADPVIKAAYAAAAQPGQTAYNLAIADFFNAPVIAEPDLTGYSGQVGQVLKVEVTDNFSVKSVSFTIFKEDGSIQEQGQAIVDANNLQWLYTTTTPNVTAVGNRIEISATDLPGNLTVRQKVL